MSVTTWDSTFRVAKVVKAMNELARTGVISTGVARTGVARS